MDVDLYAISDRGRFDQGGGGCYTRGCLYSSGAGWAARVILGGLAPATLSVLLAR